MGRLCPRKGLEGEPMPCLQDPKLPAHPLPCLPSWFMGRRPEYTDPKVVAQGEGREGKGSPLTLGRVGLEGTRWAPRSQMGGGGPSSEGVATSIAPSPEQPLLPGRNVGWAVLTPLSRREH